jgi:hypothetical protein
MQFFFPFHKIYTTLGMTRQSDTNRQMVMAGKDWMHCVIQNTINYKILNR